MQIQILSDPIDIQQVVAILQTVGLVVIDTTRSNARAIEGKVNSFLGNSILHASFQGSDGNSYHYMVFLSVMDYDREAIEKGICRALGAAH